MQAFGATFVAPGIVQLGVAGATGLASKVLSRLTLVPQLDLPPIAPPADIDGATTRVGRWMGGTEFKAMNATGLVQAPLNGAGATHVTVPPNPLAFDPPRGSTHFVEFNVPNEQLRLHDPTQGWGRVFGPDSFEARFAVSKGLTPPMTMPPATNIVHTASAVRRP